MARARKIKDIPSAISSLNVWVKHLIKDWEYMDNPFLKQKMSGDVNNAYKVVEKMLRLTPKDELGSENKKYKEAYEELMARLDSSLQGVLEKNARKEKERRKKQMESNIKRMDKERKS